MDVARDQLEEERRHTEGECLNLLKLNWSTGTYLCHCSELRKAVAEETAAREALLVVSSSVPKDYEDLEEAAVAACQGLESDTGSSGSSLASCLRSLGGRLTERLKGALRLGVQKALGVVSMHYVVNFEQLATGYIVLDGDEDRVVDAMEQADAVVEGATSTLAELFEGDLFPSTEDDEDEGARDGEDDL
jgi:hypothetical protein